jgi:hypothetical protein
MDTRPAAAEFPVNGDFPFEVKPIRSGASDVAFIGLLG